MRGLWLDSRWSLRNRTYDTVFIVAHLRLLQSLLQDTYTSLLHITATIPVSFL